MAWRDELQPASFRGAAFHVRGSEATVGRRTASHEFPGKDVPYVEDLGRRGREFTLDAFVLGTDVIRDRDALIEAIEAAGAGELVHPYRGRMMVAVPSGRWMQATDEGGLVRFSITFQETSEAVQPAVRADTQAGVEVAAEEAETEIQSVFADEFETEGWGDFIQLEALDDIQAALAEVRQGANGILQRTSAMPGFLRQLTGISATAGSLLRFPASLAGSVFSQVAGLRSIALTPVAALLALGSLFDFGRYSQLVTGTTPMRQRQVANQAAVANLVQQAALVEASRASTELEFASYDEAVAVRDDLAERLEEAAATAPDAAYAALTDLRAAVVRDITARGADLSRIVRYTPPATLPALVVAYQLYGDAQRETEIVARNRIRHPGFVAGGRPLEVLT